MKLGAPCIIIVGDVVKLQDKLNWYEKLPLFGKTIVVTRMREKSGALRERLEEEGASVLEFPVIEIAPPKSFKEIDQAIRDLGRYDWMIFTSAYGADSFFSRLRQKFGKDARALGKIKIACVGPETARLVEKHGIVPDLCPARYEALAIGSEFKKRFGRLDGKNILLVRARIAPAGLEQDLASLGARVKRVIAYETNYPKKISADIKEAVLKGRADVVTFTSASTVDHFAKALGRAMVKKISRKTRFATIGPVTTGALKRLGIKSVIQAKEFTIEGLVGAIIKSEGRAS